MIKIKGKLTCEKEKALRLEIIFDEEGVLTGTVIWIPKSLSRICNDEITVLIPRWFYKNKIEEIRLQGGSQYD